MFDRKFKILVVDDEKTVRQSICLWAKDQGYHVHDVSSGEECIEFLKTFNDVDIVLTWLIHKKSCFIYHGFVLY